jgi:hypothetical protein
MVGNDRAKRRWLRRALISSLVLLTACAALFFSAPKLLIAPAHTAHLAKSDVILHSAIGAHSKADEYVASLYHQGVARKIVCVSSQVSWETYPGDYVREHLISLGVRAEDVFSLRLPIAPCGAMNLPTIVGFVKERGWKSALLITHPENSRYAARMVHKYFGREGIATAVSYAPADRDALTDGWWRAHWKTQRFVGQAMSITFDLFYSECR